MKHSAPADDQTPGARAAAGTDQDRREQRLAELLSQMADRVAEGQVVDLEQVCRQHTDLADDLRNLWGAVLVTDATGAFYQQAPRDDDTGSWQRLRLPVEVGDYRLLEEIGRGGMGVVFRARQISLDREVAVKMILRGRLASESDLQRFLAEAAATARLEHPHIVPVYEVADVDGRPFFSMQFIEGQTLADRLADGPLPQREAASIVSSVARAIAFAHRQGVLHRDLKPSNILLDRAGKPLVSDFGLAKQITDDGALTLSGMVVGTPAYMSPEQAGGRGPSVGPTSDVYSLGCVLYHALTGRPPLVAESPVQLVLLVLEQDPPPPRALRPRIDRDLEMIVVRCLQKPPDLRYATADALADDLDAFLNDERIMAASGRFGQIVARWFRETHHAVVLENWGLLWMWHSLVLLTAGLLTWGLQHTIAPARGTYAALWTVGLGAWAAVFWILRRRQGPVTFIERQIAHVWAASMVGIVMLFPLEWWLGLPVLGLSPLLGVIAAMVFIVKAGMLSGAFYLQAAALIAVAVLMAWHPPTAHLTFALVAALCFFVPGLKYYRQRRSKS